MTTEMIPADKMPLATEIAAMTTDQLKRELAAGLRMTATHLARLAMIVRALEDRGEDLAEVQAGLLGYLRRIAHGQLLPEVVVRFAESPQLIQRVAALPIPDQQRLADGAPVKVVVLADGGPTHRMIDPLRLARDQVTQVFAAGRIRDDAEQVAIIENRRNRPAKPKPERKRVYADLERGGIVVGRAFASHAHILRALTELASHASTGPDDGPPQQLGVIIAESEYRHLGIRAAECGCSRAEMARKALRAMGMI